MIIFQMGLVYLIGERNNATRFKIGVTKKKDVDLRRLELQTGNPEELFVYKTFKTDYPFKLEKMLHNSYYSKRIMNEWFELTTEDTDKFLEKCAIYNEGLKALNDEHYFDDILM